MNCKIEDHSTTEYVYNPNEDNYVEFENHKASLIISSISDLV